MAKDPIRLCAHCEQEVVPIPEPTKEWTTRSGDAAQFKHRKLSENGIQNCGRQFLAEHDTYTERDSDRS